MTELGKILKSIRLENGQILRDMAVALGVTSSYLSAVENGKRPMPEEWMTALSGMYNLSTDIKIRIMDASDELRKSIKMNVENTSDIKRETAIVFARSFDEMDDETARRIRQVLLEGGGA